MIDIIRRLLEYASFMQCRCGSEFRPDFWTYILTGRNKWG